MVIGKNNLGFYSICDYFQYKLFSRSGVTRGRLLDSSEFLDRYKFLGIFELLSFFGEALEIQ